jgi:hypothetical protein
VGRGKENEGVSTGIEEKKSTFEWCSKAIPRGEGKNQIKSVIL